MLRVLIVEDEKPIRELLNDFLTDEGYVTLLAENGEEGVEIARTEHPDLILMDLGMPVMDGWEATRRIKHNEALKRIPIIAVTSHAMVGDEIEARKAGCDDYLSKPIDEDLLLQKIKKFLS